MQCGRARRRDGRLIDTSRGDVDGDGECNTVDVRLADDFPYGNRTPSDGNDDAIPAATSVDAHRGASRLGSVGELGRPPAWWGR